MKRSLLPLIALLARLTADPLAANPCLYNHPSTPASEQCDCGSTADGKWLSCERGHLQEAIGLVEANTKWEAKSYHELYASDASIVELTENILSDVSFRIITFHDCPHLTRVHAKAFEKIESKIISFEISGENQLSDETVFRVVSRMVRLRTLRLFNTKLTSIPAHAFRPSAGEVVLQEQLRRVSFDSLCSRSPIRSIGSQAFARFPNLIHLDLSCLQIDTIAGDAFQFVNGSTVSHKLLIDLSDNRLTENSFPADFAIGGRRAVELILNYNPMKYLNESVFGSFLAANPANRIVMWQNQRTSRLDCDSCDMAWIANYGEQVGDTVCGDGESMSGKNKDLLKRCPPLNRIPVCDNSIVGRVT